MDIDRNLLGRAAALLSEARDVIERVRAKASDYPAAAWRTSDHLVPPDEDAIAKLSTLIVTIEDTFHTVDALAKED